jgi:hypothetical protein
MAGRSQHDKQTSASVLCGVTSGARARELLEELALARGELGGEDDLDAGDEVAGADGATYHYVSYSDSSAAPGMTPAGIFRLRLPPA